MLSSIQCDRGVILGTLPESAVRHPRLLLVACILASSIAFVNSSALSVALPEVGQSLAAGAGDLQWVINAYLLPFSALQLLGGTLGDRYGRRWLLVVGLLLLAQGSMLCAAAPSLEILLGARALQGAGAALLLPNSLAILGASFEGPSRNRVVGIWAAATAVANAVGPVMGGWLVEVAGWRALFLMDLPLVAAVLLLAYSVIPEADEDGPHERLDLAGAALATGALGFIVGALIMTSSAGVWQWPAVVSVLTGTVLLALFIRLEADRGDAAMILGGLFTARAMVRFGLRWLLACGAFVMASGLALATRIEPASGYLDTVLPAVVLLAAGLAAVAAPLTAAVLAAVDARHAGVASGLNSALARTGGLVAVALTGGVLTKEGADLVVAARMAAQVGFLVCLTAGCVALFAGGARPAPKGLAV
jgi:predicted MFS family arabinose efflux permease